MPLDFAHFGNGDSVISDLVLVNVADQPVRPAIYFYDKGGELIDPESVMDFMGDLGTTDYGALILQSELPPLGELTISTHGSRRDGERIGEGGLRWPRQPHRRSSEI